GAPRKPDTLEWEEEALGLDPRRAVSPDATAAGDDPVAGHDDRHRVAAHRVADGPGRAGASDHLRQLAVRDGLTEAHVTAQRLVHGLRERGIERRQIDRHRKAVPSTAEVLVDLDRDLVVALLDGVAVDVEVDRSEPDLLHAAVAREHREHPDRRFLTPPACAHPGSSSCTSARSSSSSSVVILIFSCAHESCSMPSTIDATAPSLRTG